MFSLAQRNAPGVNRAAARQPTPVATRTRRNWEIKNAQRSGAHCAYGDGYRVLCLCSAGVGDFFFRFFPAHRTRSCTLAHDGHGARASLGPLAAQEVAACAAVWRGGRRVRPPAQGTARRANSGQRIASIHRIVLFSGGKMSRGAGNACQGGKRQMRRGWRRSRWRRRWRRLSAAASPPQL